MTSDTLTISKVSETQIGDTLIKEFSGGFKYYIFNDTIFSKHEGDYFIIGANNAQVGDIWHSLRYHTNSNDPMDYLIEDACAVPRNLKITNVETIYINGVQEKKIHLG